MSATPATTRTTDKCSGFSLPETLAVLAIAGISASLATPALRNIVRSDRYVTAANELVSTLRAARSVATSRNTRVVVCPSSAGRKCEGDRWEDGWIAFTDDNGDGRVGAEDRVIATVPVQPGVAIRSQELSTALTYQSTGQVIAADGNGMSGLFAICDRGAREPDRIVAVPPTGEPRVVNDLPAAPRPVCPSGDPS